MTADGPMQVRVTAVDYNPAARERPFDGPAFRPTPIPRWLVDAVLDGRVRHVTPLNTDYAQWTVSTPAGVVTASPDDFIELRDGDLQVRRNPRTARRARGHGRRSRSPRREGQGE